MIITERIMMGGVQKIHRFDNGFGASVIRHDGSYGSSKGLWEVALIKFSGEGNDDWSIRYHDIVNNDVVGWLDNEEVQDLLNRIEALPKEENVHEYGGGPTRDEEDDD